MSFIIIRTYGDEWKRDVKNDRFFESDEEIDREFMNLVESEFSEEEQFLHHPEVIKYLDIFGITVGECITQFRNIMQPASRQEAQKLVQRERRKITHSIYHDWEEVRKTAILILRHMGIFVRETQAEKTIHGVLINMNWVWEQYLQSILEDEIKEEYTFQPQNERETFFRIPDKESQRKLKPDLCIYKKGNKTTPALILDAKYKNAWSDAAQNGNFNEKSVREDCFQILAYMYRFRCNKAGIFCPCIYRTVKKVKIIASNPLKKQWKQTKKKFKNQVKKILEIP